MYNTDREGFTEILRKLSVTFAKELTDEVRAAYWEALKDLPISTVQRMAESHARYSKFFPKPFELRPKQERPKDPDPTWLARKAEFDRLAAERLDLLWHTNREAWLKEVSARVFELGRLKGLPDTYIREKLRDYVPRARA